MTERRACLSCEGRGTIRRYQNIAGDFDVEHCERCGGTGKVAGASAGAIAPLDLEPIKARLAIINSPASAKYDRAAFDRAFDGMLDIDVPALIAEIERLRGADGR